MKAQFEIVNGTTFKRVTASKGQVIKEARALAQVQGETVVYEVRKDGARKEIQRIKPS